MADIEHKIVSCRRNYPMKFIICHVCKRTYAVEPPKPTDPPGCVRTVMHKKANPKTLAHCAGSYRWLSANLVGEDMAEAVRKWIAWRK